MRQLFVCFLLSLPSCLLAVPVTRESAFHALSAIPIEEIPRVAKIAGCEGRLVPDRWHFLVYAPETENGYREYVVSNHRVVVRRELSQFAETLRPEDIMGVDAVKVDSDRLVALAQQYARANRASLGTCNFELSREGPGLAPRWKVDCFGADGQALGSIIVNATQERVVAHEGFKKEPPDSSTQGARTNASTRRTAPATRPAARPQQLTVGEPFLEPVADAPEQRYARPVQIRRAQPAQPEPPRGPLTRVVRGIFGNDDD